MSAILWKFDKLLVDSFVVKGGEWMEVTDKVIIAKSELRLLSEDGKFDDYILGLTYTGARRPAFAFGKTLRNLTTLMNTAIEEMTIKVATADGPVKVEELKRIPYTYDSIVKLYAGASELELFNMENNCSILLIGVNNAYEVEMTSEGGLRLEVVPPKTTIAMGSGHMAMAELDQRHDMRAEPVRMMQYAIQQEASCGGRIYVYERVEDVTHTSKKALVLTGIYEPPSKALMRVADLAAQIPMEPDLILNQYSYRAGRRSGDPDVSALDYKPRKPGKPRIRVPTVLVT